jgi:hypothetical protein
MSDGANALLKGQAERWYPLKEHPVQRALVNAISDGARFCVVPAGRRSGKTERAKRFLVKQALANDNRKYFAAAPTYGQAKRIWWDDLKALSFSHCHDKPPSETELRIFLPNGSEIYVIGLDQPQRIEGTNWSGGIIDEVADVKSEALQANIMPALDTIDPRYPDYRAWCLFIGVPEGLNHFYEMYEHAKVDKTGEWRGFTWKSADILDPDVIASRKAMMSARQFNQEYCASFETASGRIYEGYGPDNYTDAAILDTEALHWAHDQNFTPLSSSVSVVRGNNLFFLQDICLDHAISRQSALEFCERFKTHKNKLVYIYGDPAGRAGEKHGHASDYVEIEQVLRENGWRFERRVQHKAPAIKDRQNAVRAMIRNANNEVRLFVNPDTAKWVHKGLATVQLQKGSTFQEDQTNKYQHITTAVGYQTYVLYPNNGNGLKLAKTTGYF